MEEEEAVLRKQLEEAEDFDERREIRQKLRELRKKKLAALETDSPATTDRDKRRAERKRQREKENEENRDTTEIKSETKTAKDAVSNEGTENDNAVVSTFQLSVSTTQALTVENGTTNGSAEEEVPVEVDDEKETIGENHSKNGVDSNEETSEQDVQEASVENGSTEDEPVEVKKEQLSDSKNNKEVMENGKEMASKQNEKTDESSLTVIEEIEDVDNLERLLKDIPLSEFELRKKIRSQIRMIKVKQESKQNIGEGIITFSTKSAVESAMLSQHLASEETSAMEGLCEGEPSLETSGLCSDKEQFGNKKDTCESMDDASSTLSSLTMSSDVTSDSASDVDLSSVTQASDHQVNVTSKELTSLQRSSSAADNSKKHKTSKVQQMDFRGQVQKKSGDPSRASPSGALGRKKGGSTQVDFRGLLKTTGVGTKQDLSAASKVNKLSGRKAGSEQVDFRSVLSKNRKISAFGKKLQGKSELPPEEVKPVPPPEKKHQGFTRREVNSSSTTESKEQAETTTEEMKPQRRVSSSDLFNLLYQPKEGSHGSDYLKQRGIAKVDMQKPSEQKFTVAHHPKDSSGEEELKAQLTWRKNKSDHFFKPADPRNERPKWKQREPETVLPRKKKPGPLECEASEEEGPDLTESQPDSPVQISPLEAPGEARVDKVSSSESAEEDVSEEDETCQECDEESATEHNNLVEVELNVTGQPETPDPECVEVKVVSPLLQPTEECIDLPNTSTTKNTKVEKDQGKHNVTSHRRDNVDGKKVQVNKTVEVSDKCEGKMTTVENKKVKPVEMSDKYGCKMEGAAMIKKNTKTSVEVSEKDGGKKVVTTKVEKNMEVHKSDGTTITVTKTTKTAEVQRKGPPVRGGIDARLAQMRKERVMAKKQAVTDTKNKRAAFMQKLESQSSSKGEVKRSFSSKSNVSLLLQWCKRRTQYHEGVDITNFTTSWANGLAFCALLHYFVPDSIPYESLQPSDKKGNWALGFRVAGEEGIEPLLELEDVMCVDVPEPKSLITYIHFVYQHFMEKQQKEKTLAQ